MGRRARARGSADEFRCRRAASGNPEPGLKSGLKAHAHRRRLQCSSAQLPELSTPGHFLLLPNTQLSFLRPCRELRTCSPSDLSHTCLSSRQIPLACSETAAPRRSAALPARRSESRSLPAPSAPAEAAWRPKASGSPLRTRQVLALPEGGWGGSQAQGIDAGAGGALAWFQGSRRERGWSDSRSVLFLLRATVLLHCPRSPETGYKAQNAAV